MQNVQFLYAGIWKRLFASLIDGVLIFIFLYTANEAKISSEVGGILMLVFPVIYGGLLEGSNLEGTLGKKIFKIKVFDINFKPVSYIRSIIRNIFKELFFILTFALYVYLFHVLGPFKASSYSEINKIVFNHQIVLVFLIIAFLIWAFLPKILLHRKDKKQMLHDLISGCIVVKE